MIINGEMCVMCYIFLLSKKNKKFYLLLKRVNVKTKRRVKSYKYHIRDNYLFLKARFHVLVNFLLTF